MKDKLVKTGHKKAYYRFIGAVKGFGFTLLALAALTAPVGIAMGVSAAEAAHAEEPSLVSEESSSSTEAVE